MIFHLMAGSGDYYVPAPQTPGSLLQLRRTEEEHDRFMEQARIVIDEMMADPDSYWGELDELDDPESDALNDIEIQKALQNPELAAILGRVANSDSRTQDS